MTEAQKNRLLKANLNESDFQTKTVTDADRLDAIEEAIIELATMLIESEETEDD